METLVKWSALLYSSQQMQLEIWCGWAHTYKTIAKFIVHSIIHCLTVSCKKINHSRYALVIWSSLQLTSKQWIITHNSLLELIYFLNIFCNRLFCCNRACYCVDMVSVTSTSRYVTSASHFQSRSSTYIRGLIPWTYGISAVPIVVHTLKAGLQQKVQVGM